MNTTNLLYIVLGIPLLFYGRRMFWLFVGVAGFIAGLFVASYYMPHTNSWTPFLVAAGVGVLGAILGIMLQRAAVWVAGFIAGGYLLVMLLKLFMVDASAYNLIIFIVGGVIGGILVAAIFEWGLIILTSLTGSILIAQNLPFSALINLILFFILLFIGIFVQFKEKGDD